MLENKNLIAKNVDLNNARIVKIEYRPLDGETRKVFGAKGKTESTNKDGEIRITVKWSGSIIQHSHLHIYGWFDCNYHNQSICTKIYNVSSI